MSLVPLLFFLIFFSQQAFMVLHKFLHTKSNRSSCMNDQKRERSIKLSHLTIARLSIFESCWTTLSVGKERGSGRKWFQTASYSSSSPLLRTVNIFFIARSPFWPNSPRNQKVPGTKSPFCSYSFALSPHLKYCKD